MNLHLPDPPAAPARRGPPHLCHSLLVVARCSLFPGAPGFVASRPAGTRCPPRIRFNPWNPWSSFASKSRETARTRPRRARGKAPERIARMKCTEHRAFGIEHLDFGTGIFTCRTHPPLQRTGDHRTSVTILLVISHCFPALRHVSPLSASSA